MSHKPRKRFGQNFLVDEAVIHQIVAAINPQNDQHLVEIGPGRGALTAKLINRTTQLDVIELDRDLVPSLQSQFKGVSGFHIYQADALAFDYTKLTRDQRSIRVIGNLPYNISTPLIFHLLDFASNIEDMHFMLQKEVVERLAAPPGSKDYGRLSVMTQYHCQVEALFNVAADAFLPAPKVESAIVRLIPHKQRPIGVKHIGNLEKLVRVAFQQRRKTLKNALKNFDVAIDPAAIGIDLSQRAERLSVEDYVRMCNSIWPE